MPPETTILMPSSTVISSVCVSRRGRNRRKPVVGLGVVGMKMFTVSSGVSSWMLGSTGPVMKPIDQQFLRGNSKRITRSEEHTSELQSLMRISYAVFCLKKKTNKPKHTQQQPELTINSHITEQQQTTHTTKRR